MLRKFSKIHKHVELIFEFGYFQIKELFFLIMIEIQNLVYSIFSSKMDIKTSKIFEDSKTCTISIRI